MVNATEQGGALRRSAPGLPAPQAGRRLVSLDRTPPRTKHLLALGSWSRAHYYGKVVEENATGLLDYKRWIGFTSVITLLADVLVCICTTKSWITPALNPYSKFTLCLVLERALYNL